MNPIDPATWTCPSDWHPDVEGPFHFEHLRAFASALLARGGTWTVRLDYEDPTCVCVDVLADDRKVGEVHVNRVPRAAPPARYSVFAGADDEYHGHSLETALALVENAPGDWDDDED